jgi:hypothetical protein
MFNAFVKLYKTCWEGREVVEFDESTEHVEREEKL